MPTDLRTIRTFKELTRYLEDHLDWPLGENHFDDITFEYQPDELGLKDEDATPINNGVHDFRHILELRTNGDDAYFAAGTRNLGIHNLRAHFVQLEKSLLQTPAAAAENEASELFRLEDALQKDIIFEELVVQRSRVYVKKSESGCAGGAVVFPTREVPRVAPYKLKVTYGRLLESVEQAFSRTKPLFALTVEKRAARGNWEDFDRIMSRVPDAPPVPEDERMETAVLREEPPKTWTLNAQLSSVNPPRLPAKAARDGAGGSGGRGRRRGVEVRIPIVSTFIFGHFSIRSLPLTAAPFTHG